MSQSSHFGTDSIGKLLKQQAIPASIGILTLSIYGIVDTIFVGRWVGSLGIGAITVVMPITFLIASIGMAIGIGGSSVMSRALGAGNTKNANITFGNMIALSVALALFFVAAGFFFQDTILSGFGGKGDLLEPSRDYFIILLIGVPFLAFAMMSNNVMRAEGHPKVAMYTLIIPAVVNLVLDPILIVFFDMGLKGAAWATTFSYIGSAGYSIWFFMSEKTSLKFSLAGLVPQWQIIKEIISIGSVTLARQGTISVLAIVLNNSLFSYGGELAVSAYGIINRVMMFANFPVIGITQGVLPIIGYNYGAQLIQRVKDSLKLSIKSATVIATATFILIMVLSAQIVQIFTTDQELIEVTTPALRAAFLATPLIAINLIGSGYFQAIGKALPALLLALTKQGFFLIPLIIVLPLFFGLNGVWYSFPIADIGAAGLTYWYLKKSTKKDLEVFKA